MQIEEGKLRAGLLAATLAAYEESLQQAEHQEDGLRYTTERVQLERDLAIQRLSLLASKKRTEEQVKKRVSRWLQIWEYRQIKLETVRSWLRVHN